MTQLHVLSESDKRILQRTVDTVRHISGPLRVGGGVLALRPRSDPRPLPPRHRGGGAGGVRQLVVKQIHGDYLTCRTWDGKVLGQGEGEEDIKVARPHDLQRTPWDGQSKTINGVSYSWAYSSDVARVKSSGGQNENQVIVPAYFVGCVIYAASVLNGQAASAGSEPADAIGLVDITPGRAWAKVFEEEA